MSKRIYNLVDLNKFQKEHGEWADSVFGSRGAVGPLNHLKKEIDELKGALLVANSLEAAEQGQAFLDQLNENVLEEYADCFLLFINSAFIQGIDMRTLMQASAEKFEVCKKREWGPVNDEGFAEHIREEPLPTADGKPLSAMTFNEDGSPATFFGEPVVENND